MSVITLNTAELHAEFNTMGAEMIALSDRNGREFLWQGDPAIWPSHAPILFPIVSRLKDGKYTLDGREYEMNSHGFAKYSEFTVEEQSDNRVVFLLRENDWTLSQYPFSFAFRAAYTLCGRQVKIEYITENRSERTMYYSVGGHEGYALDGAVENYSIIFDEPETVSRYYAKPGNVFCRMPLPHLCGEYAFRLAEHYFQTGATVFYDLKSRGVTLRDERSGREIHVDYPGFDTLVLWKKPDAEYLCIEPWAGAPDLPWKEAADFSEKYRIRPLAPGARETLVHTITV